jgi:hypothetical protein
MLTDFPGSATALIPRGITFLDPEERVFEAMLEGWKRQQLSRHLKTDTCKDRLRVARDFQRFKRWVPEGSYCEGLVVVHWPLQVNSTLCSAV